MYNTVQEKYSSLLKDIREKGSLHRGVKASRKLYAKTVVYRFYLEVEYISTFKAVDKSWKIEKLGDLIITYDIFERYSKDEPNYWVTFTLENKNYIQVNVYLPK